MISHPLRLTILIVGTLPLLFSCTTVPTHAPVSVQCPASVVRLSFFDPSFSPLSPARITKALGSGVFLDRGESLLVAAAHSGRHAKTIIVDAGAEWSFKVKIVKLDLNHNIAFLVPANEEELQIARAAQTQGKWGAAELAIDHPEESTGIACGFAYGKAPNRRITKFRVLQSKGAATQLASYPVIVVDTTVHPGESGGGLFAMNGRLVGLLVSIIRKPSGTVTNPGFAIPLSSVDSLLKQRSISQQASKPE